MRQNIVFNTTRQWNPGDQFIMLGILRLLRHLDFNIIIYNRHPNIWGKGKDNSFKPDKHSFDNIDYYIHAGSPEVYDEKMEPLFDGLIKHNIPSSFIGIGVFGGKAVEDYPTFKVMLERSELITARDEAAYDSTKQFGSLKLPCPGLLCGNLPQKHKTMLDLTGLVFMTCQTRPNTISPELYKDLVNGYRRIIAEHNAIIICHYIDEAIEARTLFPHTPIFYSYDARDYEDFYNRCDLVISPRLHGVLLSAGLGIPCYIIGGYDIDQIRRRMQATKLIGTPFFDTTRPEYFTQAIGIIDIEEESRRLVDLRYITEMNYLNLFITSMPKLYSSTPCFARIEDEILSLENKRSELNG